MIINRSIYVISLLVALLFYVAYRKWFAWLVLFIVILLPWFSLLLSLRAMLRTNFVLSAPEYVLQGAEELVQLEVCGTRTVPTFGYVIRAERPNTGERWRLRSGARLPTQHCGGLILKAERLRVCDHLGLFAIRKKRPPSLVVYVLPEEPGEGERMREPRVVWRPKSGGGYSENHEIRPYADGDTLESVHWKLSEKAGKLMLRQAMEPQNGYFVITMELRRSKDPTELDRKYSQLNALTERLLVYGVAYEAVVMTGNGIKRWRVHDVAEHDRFFGELLCEPCASEKKLAAMTSEYRRITSDFHIGGDTDAL